MRLNKIYRGYSLRLAFVITIMAILMLVGNVDAIPMEEWNRTFGEEAWDYAYSVQQTSESGYILAGSFGADAWLIKTDANGNKAWNKTFGEIDYFDRAVSVQQTIDDGYILAGDFRTPYADAWLIKTDANGNEVWNNTFGELLKWDFAYSVHQTIDGGYIIAGNTESYGAGLYDAWLIKTDANGNKVWDKTFGGTKADIAYSGQQTIDGGYILAGWTDSYGSDNSDAWLVKTDANGNEVWNKTFGGFGSNYASDVQQTSEGGFILAGYTYSNGAGLYDAWLIKTDANGNKVWDKTFGGNSNDFANSVKQTKNGGYILAGYTESYGAGSGDAWLIKTEGNGNKVWDKTFGGIEEDRAYSVQQTIDDGYILAGYTDSYGAGSRDAWFIKVSSDALPQPPNISSFAPFSPVIDVEGATRTFNITVNQTVNVSWEINGTEVFNEIGVITSSYTNTSAAKGIWNVNSVANNANGIAIQTWVWIVTSVPTAGSISGFKINDTNGNGKWDASENGISNWTVRLIGITGTGKGTKVIRKETFTDAMGFYKFDNLQAGRYIVIEKLKKGFVPTGSPVKRIKLAQDENSMNNNFTNRPLHSRDRINGQRDIDDYEVINRDIDKYKEDIEWN